VQDLAGITDLADVIAVIWPWVATGEWTAAELARCTVRWRWHEPGKIWIEDGESVEGDKLLVYYRKRRAARGWTARRRQTWSRLRLQEFRRGLGDMARAAGPVRPVWGEIGL
jgi:hypothetical protein